MNIFNKIAIAASGFFAGITFVIACGDGETPQHADAASQCDCPLAEPPLKGRITRAAVDRAIPAMSHSVAAAACDPGAVVLSGGCLSRSTDPKFTLNSSYAAPVEDPIGWACDFYNGTAAAVTSTAYVTCLKPAP
jgi:hypothetical protein